jgi:hypothetical protein
MTLNLDIATILQGLVLAILIAGIRGIFSMGKRINEMSTTITEIQTRAEGREKLSAEKFAVIDRNVAEIWRHLNAAQRG